MKKRRTASRATVLAGVVGLAAAALTVLPAAPSATAHGAMTYPATRTYACYVNGLEGGNGGDLNPTNPACAAAVAQGGKQPLWDWFGNLLPNIGKQWSSLPAGSLCGPSDKYAAYRAARTDWPTTEVRAGAQVTMRYNAWARHPGTWYQFVTKDGWDPSRPLSWSDLEAWHQVTNPPVNGNGPHGPEYTWSATMPNKTGRHIIYSVWERSDSPEGFFNCSDVVFTR
ncbi:lytic polysaccharide monooxygenase auxiliary activity family 9 protein [Actinophytocola xanthii]|uniref:lytic polysaccharide monooxygenase auxiliary activity family 9 protein n=1 Tax=Actinophytocola xanthii TaxID=1912961 RepID=UPI000A561A36|nr:lytic polysaccharide monooxygenase [Actinophytocola xanthii]